MDVTLQQIIQFMYESVERAEIAERRVFTLEAKLAEYEKQKVAQPATPEQPIAFGNTK